jgi:Tfp pilus assembly protein FimT
MADRKRERGTSLAEMVVAVAIVGLIGGVAVPRMLDRMNQAALKSSAWQIREILLEAQERASATKTNTGVKFIINGSGWSSALYEDHNENGVLNKDIAAGVDVLLEGPRSILAATPAHLGFPADGVTDPSTGEPMAPEKLPVNFNQSTICSFSPNGDGTPGTVYLSAGPFAAAVRSSGAGGAVRVLHFNRSSKKWQSEAAP